MRLGIEVACNEIHRLAFCRHLAHPSGWIDRLLGRRLLFLLFLFLLILPEGRFNSPLEVMGHLTKISRFSFPAIQAMPSLALLRRAAGMKAFFGLGRVTLG